MLQRQLDSHVRWVGCLASALFFGLALGGCPQPGADMPGMEADNAMSTGSETDASGAPAESESGGAAPADPSPGGNASEPAPDEAADGGGDPDGNASNPSPTDGSVDGSPDEGAPDGGPAGGVAPPADVNASLNRLGVDTAETPRVDETGDALPEDYSPLGSEYTAAQTDELFVMGMQLRFDNPAGGAETLDNLAGFLELTNDDTKELELGLDLLDPGQPWEADATSPLPGFGGTSSGAHSTRAAAAGDIDGDGRDEIMIVYIADSAAAGTQRLFLTTVDADNDAPSARVSLGDYPGALDVEVAAGDFDGDGDADLALGVSTATGSELRILLNKKGVFSYDDSAATLFTPTLAGAEVSLELAAGNLDRDNGHELVAVFNEFDYANRSGQARYWVFDDAKAGYAILAGDLPVQGRDGQMYQAMLADVAVGDIDADARDEIIFAGPTEFHERPCDSLGHIHVALQDAGDKANPLGEMAARFIRDTYIQPGTGCDDVTNRIRVLKVFVSAFDFDGDGVDEIVANRHVFEDFAADPNHAFVAPQLADGTDVVLPYDAFLKRNDASGGVFSDATAAIVTGDVTGDGREDVISFVQWRDEISVWGLIGPDAATWSWQEAMTIDTAQYNGGNRVFPIIVACDVDPDGVALKYSEGEYRVVFTEPIIMAALAAAPCEAGIEQNQEACRTSYGTAESQRLAVDGTVSVRASQWVGGEVKFFGIGASVKTKTTQTASFSASRAYELEQTVTYTTGPMEDTVICTVLPIDQYSYEVLSHPDPNQVGRTLVINMPRTPITLQVEREFFNASTPAGSFKVNRNVFLHTPGAVDSYPTEGDADALIDTGGLGHLGPLGELVDSVGAALGPIAEHLLGKGIKSSRSVGVGATRGGESSIDVKFAEHTDYRAGLEIDYELEAEATVPGAVVGGSVGGSVGAGLSWGSSNATIYSGSVGDIAPEDFGGNSYRYGLFTYIYNYGDRTKPQFEVVNYWVER